MKLAVLSISGLAFASLVGCASMDNSDDADSWRDAIVANPTTADGCYHATYPDMEWSQISCSDAPSRTYDVGNGNDFAIHSTGKIASTSGTFTHVKGVKTENDDGTPNGYSIQLNSNFMSGTAACKGVSGCLSWAQFVYSSEEQSAFIQNWLIGIGTCPSTGGFMDAGGGDCFANSRAVAVDTLPIADLSEMKMSGTAVNKGNDTLVFAVGTEAFTTSEKDTVTNLASAWDESEFNIIGDGGASEAVFNTGASMTVRIGINDHTKNTPTCIANDGTTGETNNLNLGKCTPFVGSGPAIQFVQSN